MSYLSKTKEIYSMMQQGQLLEAFDQYYAGHVVMIEPTGSREGKEACRAHEVQFLENVQEFHSLELKSIAADEANGIVFSESTMDVTFKDGNRLQMEQVSVQQWEGDHIVHERFYYHGG